MANNMWNSLIGLSLLCSNVFSFMDMEELKSVYYGLDILSDPVVITQDIPVGAVHVTSKFGQQYQCTFPNHSLDERRKEEEEKIAIETGIVDLLKPMRLNDCLFKSKDWWSYEFCFGKYIRQFHMEDGEIKGNIIYLGHYYEDFDWNNETAREERTKSKSALNRYHSQLYTLGTKCDLTDQMRKAEVRFICEENSEDYLSRVDESETCVYTVTVVTSRICRHPYLKAPAKRKAVPITCNPILSTDDFQDYMQEKQEKQQKEEALKAAAKDALSKEDASKQIDLDEDLSKTLENEMSSTAKKLLIQQFSELLTKDGAAPMSKEEFQKTYGDDEKTWLTYQKGIQLRAQQEAVKKMKGEQGTDETASKDGEGEEKDENEADEDDEILSEFDEELSTIKAKFQTSQNKLSSIERKLTFERHWESEIENAIREAEEELGVKVDRSLISGLSNTLDKLVNTLHDTQREMSSMDKQIGKLKPGQKIIRNNADDKGDDVENELPSSDTVDETDNLSEEDEDIVVNRHDAVGVVKPSSSKEPLQDFHNKIQAPPKTGDKTQATQSSQIISTEDGVYNDDTTTVEGDTTGGRDTTTTGSTSEERIELIHDGDEEDKIEITVKNIDNSEVELPKSVQKLLEESVRKELEKHKQGADSQALSFDSDHSFNRDKTVHIIQQEDEDGKTNKLIFVFIPLPPMFPHQPPRVTGNTLIGEDLGFNTFTDEVSESDKQSSLEENYNFVYNRRKGKQAISA